MAPAFTVFTHPGTPNGLKLAFLLAELEQAYPKSLPEHRVKVLEMWRLEHREPWYLRINPNGKVPAFVHHRPDGVNHAVFESTAIIVYIAQQFDPEYKLSFSPKSDEQTECLEWTFWGHEQMAPILTLTSQTLTHPAEEFLLMKKHLLEQMVDIFGVMNERLEGRDWLVGEGRGMCSIADISIYPWILVHQLGGIRDLSVFPNILRWKTAMEARPGTGGLLMQMVGGVGEQ
ncbi:hypothetical protein DL93DRAFT_1381052 [Clavulina sp. PMI_390]|nr:hypothetical protein DL93DRAFT_1381052 [Clavulina sp. PMI_390]